MIAKFYSDSNRYMGYSEANGSNYLELRSWLLSGNYLVINNERVSTISGLDKELKKYSKTTNREVNNELRREKRNKN